MSSKKANDSFAEIVREEWMADRTVNAWRRWHKKTVPHLQQMTQALLEAGEIASGSKVLDLASGSGEPAVTIASLVGPQGQVVATDLSEGMLAVARENCGDSDNIEFREADAHDLPFADNRFDAVTCRLGVMYFWDCQRALKEILRVLKPGGRAAFVVWGPVEKNNFARIVISPFAKRKASPILPPEAQHPFRFAESGSLSAALNNAGFSQLMEQQKVVSCPWLGPPEEMWEQIYELAAPLQPFFDSFDPDERNAAVREVIEEFGNFYDGEYTDPTTSIIVAAGIKSTSL
ncbi:class I SAM-dependent methyltransferase [Candidatus Thiosymbion oneisti]|uniref:class I SAM-dependent methyltransferase n=1 Tax=Candidatus Thiosymbion oneisti TaxID=589554 RepID=UPI000B7F9704|nr:methyltransferase domain-containing protein [Candidatus Thiosymbion oneisti]